MAKQNSNYFQSLFIKEVKVTKDTIIVIQKEQKKIGIILMMNHIKPLMFQNVLIKMHICLYMRESNENKKIRNSNNF